MHTLMLVTLSLPEGSTSDDARRTAYSRLADDSSFCGEGGRFGNPLTDGFVLGGRWSGMLREAILGQPYKDALAREFPAFTQDFYSSRLVEQHRAGLDELWQRLGGTGHSPLTRSGYDDLGAEDDAMPIDPLLYDVFLKARAGTDRQIGDDARADFIDLDGDEAAASFIGRKWLVVVDYHN